jgi:hypothetical protein
VFQIPESQCKSTLTLPLPFRDFSYHDFSTRDIKQIDLPNPEPRYADTLMHTRADYSMVSSPRRDFGLRYIVNPDVYGFRTFLSLNSILACHLSSHQFLWPHAPLVVGISRFAILRFLMQHFPCLQDSQIVEPRLLQISRHTSRMMGGSD